MKYNHFGPKLPDEIWTLIFSIGAATTVQRFFRQRALLARQQAALRYLIKYASKPSILPGHLYVISSRSPSSFPLPELP